MYFFFIFLTLIGNSYFYTPQDYKIVCRADWFIFHAVAHIRPVKDTIMYDKNIIIWEGKVDTLPKIFDFFVGRLLELHKWAVRFRSYIDTETHLPVELKEYDKSNKLVEHIYYDREKNLIKSLKTGKILTDVPPTVSDGLSILLRFLTEANGSELEEGKTFESYMNIGTDLLDDVKAIVKDHDQKGGDTVYTIVSQKLPRIWSYPVRLEVDLQKENGIFFPKELRGTIKIPVLGKILVKGSLCVVRS